MADFLTNSAEWMPLVRMKLGVDEIDLPDATLNNTILIDIAEERVKTLLATWSTDLVDHASNIKMAAATFLAAEWTEWCERNTPTLEYEGPYRSERAKIRWDDRHRDLIAEAFKYLGKVDSEIALYKTVATVVSPATELFATS